MAASGSDIIVLGGGPAGCAAARLLATWGHDVTLVTRPEADRTHALAESLTPSCGKFFDVLGIRPAIDAEQFIRSSGNTVWWGRAEPRVETFADGMFGWQVTSVALERAMLRGAVEAGARVERVSLAGDDAVSRPASFRIDATGRAGILARTRAGRCVEQGHRTVALSGVWHLAGDSWQPDPSHTWLESYGDGWAWSVPLDQERRAVAVMVDPQTTVLRRGDGARRTYLDEIAKTRRLRDLLESASLEAGPMGWDASMYYSAQYAGEDWLVTGDAASFVDPLSSSGVKKALASGWLAAITAHTVLNRPGLSSVARDFYSAREADMYARFLTLTRHYLREGAGGVTHPFWAERTEGSPWDDQRDESADRPAVMAAWDRLREAPDLRLRRGGVSVESRPAIGGNEIVLEARLVTSADDPGLRFMFDVNVVALVELAPRHRQVPDLYQAVVTAAGPTDLAAFLTALATAIAKGWLVFD